MAVQSQLKREQAAASFLANALSRNFQFSCFDSAMNYLPFHELLNCINFGGSQYGFLVFNISFVKEF